MITAGDRVGAGKFTSADGKRHSPVRTPVFKRETFSVMPDKEQFLAKDCQGNGAATQFARHHGGIPIVAKPQHRLIVTRPRAGSRAALAVLADRMRDARFHCRTAVSYRRTRIDHDFTTRMDRLPGAPAYTYRWPRKPNTSSTVSCRRCCSSPWKTRYAEARWRFCDEACRDAPWVYRLRARYSHRSLRSSRCVACVSDFRQTPRPVCMTGRSSYSDR